MSDDSSISHTILILGNSRKNRAEAEISFADDFIGIVYETQEGWIVEHANINTPIPPEVINEAKSLLLAYVNRKGIEERQDLSVAAHSLLLLLKIDGTTMGKELNS